MKNAGASFAYQQSAAHGASPLGQVVALYDTILRDFRRALAAIESGDVEARVFETNHALAVVAHLENVLDHKRGGEAAKHLSSFYKVTRALIVEASVNASSIALGKLIEQYKLLRDAWHQVELESPPAAAPAIPVAPQVSTPAVQGSRTSSTADTTETPRATWSA
jgi:flagellar biosynthetic protein FliS